MSVVRASSGSQTEKLKLLPRARDKEKCTARRAAGSDSSVRAARKSICRPCRAAGALRAACAP